VTFQEVGQNNSLSCDLCCENLYFLVPVRLCDFDLVRCMKIVRFVRCIIARCMKMIVI
jgi:hypothetical protein